MFSTIYRLEAHTGVWNPLTPFLPLSWYQQRKCAEAFLVVVHRGLHLKDVRPASTEQRLRSIVTAFVWICNQKASEFSSLLCHYMICWLLFLWLIIVFRVCSAAKVSRFWDLLWLINSQCLVSYPIHLNTHRKFPWSQGVKHQVPMLINTDSQVSASFLTINRLCLFS